MDIKKVALLTLVSIMAFSATAYGGYKAKHGQRFDDYAKVTSVDPIYRTIRINRPERECWDEERTVEHEHGVDSTAGAIIGGILGGVAGHQVGNGRGNTAATIVGTILGGTIGRDMADNNPRRVESHVNSETVCRTVDRYDEEERLQGYQVGYRYQGRDYDIFMKRHPGKRLKIKVKLDVVE